MTDEIGPRHVHSRSIPRPAHRIDRAEALPGQHPKPAEDDLRAPEALRRILQSATYREADQDVDFLQGGQATRGIRLQLDFLKTESLLEEQRVAHTIVVFGSTRIREPQAARRAVEACTGALAANPDDEACGVVSRLRGGSQRRADTTKWPASSAKLSGLRAKGLSEAGS
jgi:hypothetical protein